MGRDIARGPELYKAYQAEQAWREKTREQKQTAYRSVAKPKTDRVKTGRVPAYVSPFNTTRAGIYFRTRGIATAQSGTGAALAGTLKAILGARVLYDPPTTATDTILVVPKYSFALLVLKEQVGDTYDAKSRKTDLPYPGQRSNSVRAPFGKLPGDANYQDAIQKLEDNADLKKFLEAKDKNAAYFRPEG